MGPFFLLVCLVKESELRSTKRASVLDAGLPGAPQG